MRINGIIAEYNPFHRGHLYHLNTARQLSQADYTVVVMSPDFVQRGEPAIFDKYLRTRMALMCGADLVLELPVCYACSSAEYFSEGAVTLLEQAACANSISFGCETPDADAFRKAGALLSEEPEEYRILLRNHLRTGLGFPAARQKALEAYYRVRSYAQIPDALLTNPNNILGIEYCKALSRRHSAMEIYPVLRSGNAYHDSLPSQSFSSATAVRSAIFSASDYTGMIPEALFTLYEEGCKNPACADLFLPLLYDRFLRNHSFDEWLDITPELSDRILKLREVCIGKPFHEIVRILSSKSMTNTRIQRALFHIILDIRQEDLLMYRSSGTVFYGKILGFRKASAPLLHHIKKNGALPLLSKMAAATRLLDPAGQHMLCQDLMASHLYRSMSCMKDHQTFKSEYVLSPVVY